MGADACMHSQVPVSVCLVLLLRIVGRTKVYMAAIIFLNIPTHHLHTMHTARCYSYEHHTAKKNCLHWWHHLQAALGRATDEWKAQKCSCIRLPLHFPRKHKPHAMQPASPPQGNRTIMASPLLPWENTTNTLSPGLRRSRTLCKKYHSSNDHFSIRITQAPPTSFNKVSLQDTLRT